MVEREQTGSVWASPVVSDRTRDGRPVFIVAGRGYVEVPLGADDAYRFLGELRLEMTGSDFRAFVERHWADVSPTVLWRLGLGPMSLAPEAPERVERARAELSRLMQAA